MMTSSTFKATALVLFQSCRRLASPSEYYYTMDD
jgi:hypothetical protein